MTRYLLVAAVLPGLLWNGDTKTAEQLKRAGIARVYVPDERAAEWRQTGLTVSPASELKAYEKVVAPMVQMRMDQASATTVPWIDANGWRYLRGVKQAFYPKVPAGRAPLAAAEAFAYDVDAIIEPAAEDIDKLGAMCSFLRRVDAARMPVLANVGVIDDGSEEIAEVLNLMSRRNLLYRVVAKPDPGLNVNIKVGTLQYPKEAVLDPNDFAARVREQLTDAKRLVRLFGSYTVLAHLTGTRDRQRLHLLNYGRRPVTDLRVRVLGAFDNVLLAESSDPKQVAKDVAIADGGTELSVPSLDTYAVIDLERRH